MLQKKDDYMLRNQDRDVLGSLEGRQITRKLFGGILLLFGLVVAFWILSTINSLLVNNDSIDLLNRFDLSRPVNQAMADTMAAGVIPGDIFLILGYIITITLLFLMARLAKLFIKAGARLLETDLKVLIGRLRDELLNLRDDY